MKRGKVFQKSVGVYAYEGVYVLSSNIYVYSYIHIFYYPSLARCRKQTPETKKKTLAQKKQAHTWTPYRCV